MDVLTFYWKLYASIYKAYCGNLRRPNAIMHIQSSPSLLFLPVSLCAGLPREHPAQTHCRLERRRRRCLLCWLLRFLSILSSCTSRRELPNEALLFIRGRTIGWENFYLWRRITVCESYNYATWLHTIWVLSILFYRRRRLSDNCLEHLYSKRCFEDWLRRFKRYES